MNVNPQLVYGRMTGYGQVGNDALKAGHDINYLSINGLLSNLKRNNGDVPLPPLNLVADFAGGAMFLLVGILSALISKKGQVIDAAMMDGSASLLSMLFAHNSLQGSINFSTMISFSLEATYLTKGRHSTMSMSVKMVNM